MSAHSMPPSTTTPWATDLCRLLSGALVGGLLGIGYGILVGGVHFITTGRLDSSPSFAAFAACAGAALGSTSRPTASTRSCLRAKWTRDHIQHVAASSTCVAGAEVPGLPVEQHRPPPGPASQRDSSPSPSPLRVYFSCLCGWRASH